MTDTESQIDYSEKKEFIKELFKDGQSNPIVCWGCKSPNVGVFE